MRIRPGIIAAAVAIFAIGAAHAELIFDPGSIKGVEQSFYVRTATSPDQSVMAWLSATPFSAGQVFAAYSTGGATWSQPVQVSGGYPDWVVADGGAGEFTLVRLSDGSYCLAWSADTGWRATLGGAHGGADSGLTYVAKSPDVWLSRSQDGRTWSPPEPVALAPTPDHDPGIIEMADGRIGVIWVSERDGNQDLSVTFRTAAGKWEKATQITAEPGRDNQYELAHVGPKYVPDSRGRLTLAWVSDRSGSPQVWTAVSQDGRRWSELRQVTGLQQQATGESAGASQAAPSDIAFLTIEEVQASPESAPAGSETPSSYNLYWSMGSFGTEGEAAARASSETGAPNATASSSEQSDSAAAPSPGGVEQRWVSHSTDFVTWSAPELAPAGK